MPRSDSRPALAGVGAQVALVQAASIAEGTDCGGVRRHQLSLAAATCAMQYDISVSGVICALHIAYCHARALWRTCVQIGSVCTSACLSIAARCTARTRTCSIVGRTRAIWGRHDCMTYLRVSWRNAVWCSPILCTLHTFHAHRASLGRCAATPCQCECPHLFALLRVSNCAAVN